VAMERDGQDSGRREGIAPFIGVQRGGAGLGMCPRCQEEDHLAERAGTRRRPSLTAFGVVAAEQLARACGGLREHQERVIWRNQGCAGTLVWASTLGTMLEGYRRRTARHEGERSGRREMEFGHFCK
jgi:hypothetical protein